MTSTLKTVQPNSFSKTYRNSFQVIFFNFVHLDEPSFVVNATTFVVLLKCSFTVLSGYLYILLNLVEIFFCLNLTQYL